MTIESGNYPAGTEFDPNAPWNQEDLPEKEIEVTISMTLSKTVKIKVKDYSIISDMDEDGPYEDIDYSCCNLKEAVKDQIALPCFAYRYIKPKTKEDVINYLELKNWNIDDFEVILE